MPRPRFHTFAWFSLAYLIAVILFGAWVRITGSGNGCGSHWPTCHGELVPAAPGTKTMIEFTHRITSGLCGIFALIQLVWSRRISKRVFRASTGVLFFVLVEAFIGAVLVKKELVAGDASVARAVVIAFHLGNTLLLTACAASAAWWSMARRQRVPAGFPRALLAAALVCLVITSMTGAVTALGDTLFPTKPALDGGLFAKVREDLSAGQHFLVRLRAVHPIVAVLSALVAAIVIFAASASAWNSRGVLAAIGAQVILGVASIATSAPGWMQLAHLLLAQVVWVLAWTVTLDAWPSETQTN